MRVDQAHGWDAALIVFGMIGLAIGAFEWSATSAFVSLRTSAAGWIIDHGPAWLLAENAPWWLLTNYPEAHDVFTWLDGGLITGWIVSTAVIVGVWISACLALAGRALGADWRVRAMALSYALIPLAGTGLFVGLTSLTSMLARAEGMHLTWLPAARAGLLLVSAGWSIWLAHRQIGSQASPSSERVYASNNGTVIAGNASTGEHAAALAAFVLAVAGVLAAWSPFVFRLF